MFRERAFQPVHVLIYVYVCVFLLLSHVHVDRVGTPVFVASASHLMLWFDLPESTSPRIMLLFHGQVNPGAHIPARSSLLGKLVFGLRRAESSERRLGEEKGKGQNKAQKQKKKKKKKKKKRRRRRAIDYRANLETEKPMKD